MMHSVVDASVAFLVAGLIFLSASMVGNAVMRRHAVPSDAFAHLFSLALGISITGTALSLLSIAGLVSSASVLLTTFWPLLLSPTRAISITRQFFQSCRPLISAQPSILILRLLTGIYVMYMAMHAVAPYYGADLTLYHLVVPRDVLRDGGYVHNDFFFAAGVPFGWHHFGLAAYLLAGEKGYLALTFCAYLGCLYLTYQAVATFFPGSTHTGLADSAPLIMSMVTIGMLQGSVSNTDVPALFFNAVLLVYLLSRSPSSSAIIPFEIGLVSGFSVAIKLTTMPMVVIAWALLFFRVPQERYFRTAMFGLGMILSASIWPAVKLMATGSPMPVFVPSLYFWNTPGSQLTTSLDTIWRMFGDWYQINFPRFFTREMLFMPILLLFAAFGLVVRDAVRVQRIRAIWGLALIYLFGVLLFSRRWDIVFHDRYHLLSYCFLAVAGLGALEWFLTYVQKRFIPGPSTGRYLALLVGVFSVVNLSYGSVTRDRQSDGTIATKPVPSLIRQLGRQGRNFGKTPNDFRDPVTRYIAEKTGANSLVATTTIAPYLLDRPFLQLLPIAQNSIDLSEPPDQLLAKLRARHVDYLDLPPYTSLNPWANEAMQHYLVNLQQISALPGVKKVAEITVAPGLVHSLYQL